MAQHDPEKRIADLERQLAEPKGGADLATTSPRSATRQSRRGWTGLVFMAAFGLLGLCMFGDAAREFYAYHAGTPTTATVQQCVNSGKSGVACTGTWSVGGKSYSGPIDDGGRLNSTVVGSRVDVHAFGGKAYMAESATQSSPVGMGFGLALVIAVGVLVVRRLRRTRR